MIIIAPNTVWNPAALETKSVPKRMLGRIAILPRRDATFRHWLRILFEGQMLRFSAALTPFVAAMLIWPRFALPIAQAPLAMILVVGLVELKMLRMSPEARQRLMTAEDAHRGIDALRFAALGVLNRLAARKGIAAGELTLVIEQSDLARVTPLTLVSLQRREPLPEVLPLDAGDRAIIAEHLFGPHLSEEQLLAINLHQNDFLRAVTLEARSVSAHARMAAFAAAAAQPA
ncbi:hypothetical protein [Oceaniglobus roseus]|uniref:hypothetical protein n=1 Tax=Oceaniglobus roseus TaxID=1737570 RepID=UPI000C7F258B|nr:hypothetical protein [Kandeliimicrobium roseum]